jgi:hypothetical protein
MCLFKAPAGATYWSMNAILNPGCEVAFEYVVESSDIVQYWPPSQQPDERKTSRQWDGSSTCFRRFITIRTASAGVTSPPC